MSPTFSFPYYQNRPHVPIVLEYGNRRQRALPLLDSGADYSLFHKQFALDLGLTWSEGEQRSFDTAYTTNLAVREFQLSLDLEGSRFPAPVCFAEIPDLFHRPLLGRAGIFDKFRITFSEQEQLVEIEPIN